MQNRFRLTLAAIALIGLTFVALHARTAQADIGGGAQYAIICFDGGRNTQVIWPDGHVDFVDSWAPEALPHPDRSDGRAFIMTTLINKVAKQGYEYVGMASGEQVVMKKVR